ncbi:MAG: hypothetical protein V4550_07340 [Gemmatimonadota bacterium]
MPDRSRSGALALAVAATVLAACSPSQIGVNIAAEPLAAGASPVQQPLTLSSDAQTKIVDAADATQFALGVQSVFAGRVSGLDVMQDSSGARLRIKGLVSGGARVPLFVIDGVPLAEGFSISMLVRAIDRIDLFEDSLSTAPYGARGVNGVMTIATSRKR